MYHILKAAELTTKTLGEKISHRWEKISHLREKTSHLREKISHLWKTLKLPVLDAITAFRSGSESRRLPPYSNTREAAGGSCSSPPHR
ncbi:hypothetical protein Barb7_02796 [Bacteroidales bacterium Barb7]|nr:hypothetical protein Barb7_02796 [Bacteroidales bacterium Barb7]